MKQRLFSLGDDFNICTDAGADAYFVDGKAFSIGAKLSFQDLNGHELAFIKQRVLSWGPTYEIYRDGALAAVIKKHLFTVFNCRFTVDVPGPNDLEASGNFTDHEYVVTRGDQQVASISKQWFTLADTYGVDIADGADDILVLASTVVIDMACYPDDGRRH
ncbi:MAG TPA: LURP-one-related family protein [Gemmatimonadaceae bacterium]